MSCPAVRFYEGASLEEELQGAAEAFLAGVEGACVGWWCWLGLRRCMVGTRRVFDSTPKNQRARHAPHTTTHSGPAHPPADAVHAAEMVRGGLRLCVRLIIIIIIIEEQSGDGHAPHNPALAPTRCAGASAGVVGGGEGRVRGGPCGVRAVRLGAEFDLKWDVNVGTLESNVSRKKENREKGLRFFCLSLVAVLGFFPFLSCRLVSFPFRPTDPTIKTTPRKKKHIGASHPSHSPPFPIHPTPTYLPIHNVTTTPHRSPQLELAHRRGLGPLQGRLMAKELPDVGDAVLDHGGPLEGEAPRDDAHALCVGVCCFFFQCIILCIVWVGRWV